MRSWGRAETAVKLVDMDFILGDCIEAAKAYGDMERSLNYLQQECPVCYELVPMSQVRFLHSKIPIKSLTLYSQTTRDHRIKLSFSSIIDKIE